VCSSDLFGRRVDRVAAFIGEGSCAYGDGATLGSQLDEITWPDAGFFGDGFGDVKAWFFNENGHGRES
jgi:hypothetical protein